MCYKTLSNSQPASMFHIWDKGNLKKSGFVTGLLKQKSSFFVIRLLKNQFLSFFQLLPFIVKNQPLNAQSLL